MLYNNDNAGSYENRVKEFKYLEGIQARKHRREKNFQEEFSLIAYDKEFGKFQSVISLRIYGTQAKNYACLWVSNNGMYANGSGSAGGYGYHRPSAAVQEAMDSAGIKLDRSIGGAGDSAIIGSLHAIAKYLGIEVYCINVAAG